jgi:aminopeptidase N
MEETSLECLRAGHAFAPDSAPSGRHYAPDRVVQVLHVAIDVTPDFKDRSVEGRTTIRFKPNLKPIRELKLDAIKLEVRSVESSEKVQGHQATDDKLTITFANEIPADKEASVTVTYKAVPEEGLYFRTPEMGYKEGDTHLFSQGEQHEGSHWYPCMDAPNFLHTSEVTCRVPEGMVVISNGRKVSEKKDAATGLVAWHWSQDKPHVNYLVSLCAGYFKSIADKYKDIPLAFYVPASQIDQAKNSFRDTKALMEFFEQEIGVPYPWAKYDQVCVNDFVAGGMENTSATTLNDSTLFTDASENLRDSESLVAHELAHQWFGDLVTCKDWSHTWLNEGFATYYETLFTGHKHGRTEMIYELYSRLRGLTGSTNTTTGIVRRNYETPNAMFGSLSYQKGSYVLHMLRCQLGEDLYRKCIKTYLERHQHGNVTTDDLRRVIEELTHRSYDQFFDQWVYHASFPQLDASYSWEESSKQAKVSIRQIQATGNDVLLFNTPLIVRFKGAFGKVEKTLQVSKKDEEFTFTLDSAPTLVRFNPECALLAKVNFTPSATMLAVQLTDTNDVVGRLQAVEQLANKKDKESIAKLKKVLNSDPFHAVRGEAARSLRTIRTDEALDALLASAKQTDARVRREITRAINGFYREEAYQFALKSLEAEKNPDIASEAIEALGAYSKPEARERLLKYLDSDSYRSALAVAALQGIRAQDDPSYLEPLLASLPARETNFTSRGYAQGLTTLGYLARNEEKKDAVREFLVGHLNSKKRGLPVAAMNALGTLGDPKAIAALEKFTTGPRDSREKVVATRVVAELRGQGRRTDEFRGFRTEMLDLQKTTKDLRKELDELKKKLEQKDVAEKPAATPDKSKKKPAPTSAPRGR